MNRKTDWVSIFFCLMAGIALGLVIWMQWAMPSEAGVVWIQLVLMLSAVALTFAARR